MFGGSAGVNADGDITIVYNAFSGIHFRRYKSDGAAESGDQVVYTSVNDSPSGADVVVNSEGWAFVSWYDSQDGQLELGKLIDPEGDVQTSFIQVPSVSVPVQGATAAINDQGKIAVEMDQYGINNSGDYSVSFSSFWADMEPVFGGPYQFTVPLGSAAGTVVGTVQAIDPDGEEVSYSLLGASDFAINSTTGVITVADPQPLRSAAVTSYTVTVQANDGYPLANVRPVTNVLINVDDPTPPQITAIPNSTIDAGESVVSVIQASDPDGSTLTYSAAIGDGASATATVSGDDLVVSPAAGYTGTFAVTVTATNGLYSAATTFNVTVVTPKLDPVNDLTTRGPIALTLTGSDASGAALNYSATIAGGGTGGAHATLSIDGNVLTITPTPGSGGTFTVTASVSDGLDTASRSFDVTVPQTPVPTITSISPTSAIQGAGQFTLTVTGTNFASGYFVLWNGRALATNFVSATTLTVTVPASDLAEAGDFPIAIGYFGNASPNSQAFTVVGQPEITGLSPAAGLKGTGPITVTVDGASFASGASVLS